MWNWLRKRLQILKQKDAMTMVEVIIAFLVLMIVLALFQQTVQLSSKVFMQSEAAKQRLEGLNAAFYQQQTEAETVSDSLYLRDGNGNTIPFAAEIQQQTETETGQSYYLFQ